MMRALIYDDAVKAKVRAQAEWAERPENWYWPERGKEAPGDNPAYVLALEVGFRAVYTHTVMRGKHFRHLSVSVDGPKYPNEVAAWTITTMFGFTGGKQKHDVTLKPDPSWMVYINEREHCIVIAQEIKGSDRP